MKSKQSIQARATQQRDQMIIEHVARNRISTNRVLHELYFHGSRPNAVTKVTARLCREDSLRKHPLIHPRCYFTLGAAAAKHLGVSVMRTEPLGPQTLPVEFATLTYATQKQNRRRLTTAEIREHWPAIDSALSESPYCLDESGETSVLEYIRVDLGGAPDHVARKTVSSIRVERDTSECDEMIACGRLRFIIITATTRKAELIRAALTHHSFPDGLSINLAVVPALVQLLARTSHGT